MPELRLAGGSRSIAGELLEKWSVVSGQWIVIGLLVRLAGRDHRSGSKVVGRADGIPPSLRFNGELLELSNSQIDSFSLTANYTN